MGTKQTNRIVASLGDSVRNIEPKTVAAVILVVVMAVLWGRVLLRSKAGTASAGAAAAAAVEKTQREDVKPEIRIRAIPLAVVAGRHDTIAIDFFRADRNSASGGNQQWGNQRMLDELGKAVVLEAIIRNAQGSAEKACINGTVVTVGSALQVQMQNDSCIIRIEAIESAGVRLSWRGRTFMLKMPE